MQKKSFTLINKGMNRDLSISKAGESAAFTNHNIRIEARDHDTLLSVTNERGNKKYTLGASILGDLIGWNVLNNHIILFTHESSGSNPDHIYRIDYTGSGTYVMRVCNAKSNNEWTYTNNVPLYSGNLDFDVAYPIESIVYYETEDIQKIYWLDGKNVLRMLNFMASAEERTSLWNAEVSEGVYATTYFDSNRKVDYGVSVEVEKDNSGNTRSNGTIQYLLTYYNKHGQETGYVWISDLIYLSPVNSGGAADETNNNRITLTFRNIDTRFTNFRVYSVFRSSYNGQVSANIVADMETPWKEQSPASVDVIVIDDAAHLTPIDATQLLYLGSEDAKAYTLAHKDGTLFLGNLKSVGRAGYSAVEDAIRGDGGMFASNGWESNAITFQYSEPSNSLSHEEIASIPIKESDEVYVYSSQLEYSSSQICTFKGGEKYRFALMFKDANGKNSDAFWIGDKENVLYPVINDTEIRRVVAKCAIPSAVMTAAANAGFKTVQLMIAEATYADRSVKAQGVVNPTMFSVWNRYNDRLYSCPSWISRPRGAEFANRHFDVVHNAIKATGEIECNFWETGQGSPTPYFRLKNYGTPDEEYADVQQLASDYNYIMLIYTIHRMDGGWGRKQFNGYIDIIYLQYDDTATSWEEIKAFNFSNPELDWPNPYLQEEKKFSINGHAEVKIKSFIASGDGYDDNAKNDLYRKLTDMLESICPEAKPYHVTSATFDGWCDNAHVGQQYFGSGSWNRNYSTLNTHTGPREVADDNSASISSEQSKWIQIAEGSASMSRSYGPSYYKKQYMFVDENVVTIDSPEIAYESASLDNLEGCKFRIVGIAPVTGRISDAKIDATHGAFTGENFINDRYSGSASKDELSGIIAWPLWKEKGLVPTESAQGVDVKKRTSDHYEKDGLPVNYWLYLWSKSGVIDGYLDDNVTFFDGENFSTIKSKTFANMRFAKNTIFHNNIGTMWGRTLMQGAVRLFNYTSSQYVSLKIGDSTIAFDKYYDGIINDVITPPLSEKTPILYSDKTFDKTERNPGSGVYLYANSAVKMTFASNPHAVVALPTQYDILSNKYIQTVLPYINASEVLDFPVRDTTAQTPITGPLLPWLVENEEAPLCVRWEEEYIPYGNAQSHELGSKKFYGEFPYPHGLQSEDYITYLWSPAVMAYPDKKVYCRVKADINHEDHYLVVDISKFTYGYDSSGNISKVILDNVDVYTDDSMTLRQSVRVKDVLYPANVSQNPTENGEKMLNVSTGEISSVSSVYPYFDFDVDSSANELYNFTPAIGAPSHSASQPYFFIAELYKDYGSGATDSRYGGISESAVQNCKFRAAGPIYQLSGTSMNIYGNEGDTYFQRWDDLRVKPLSANDTNQVIDIVSVMLETHINIDGRCDKQRGTRYLASIDTEHFNQLNPTYSQPDNFISRRDLDKDFNLDKFSSSITWTLEKHDMDEIDEWMHITLANTLKLDGDQGDCQALRRYENALVAFQDRCLSEILFNSRTQISTTDGAPIEIANSGKVDGKRIISYNSGCTNKWSIVEGKKALYYVDNINKAFCAFSGSVTNLSEKLGFTAWFKEKNSMDVWTPNTAEYKNFVAYYDRINSDIYLVGKDSTVSPVTDPCLVFNETLGVFTSFFDYNMVPMMTNIGDEFVSFKNGYLWRQNKGKYGYFFDTQKAFSIQYRVSPEPFSDKIWSNIEYRADFYRVLDSNGDAYTSESKLIDGRGNSGDYLSDVTFDSITVWNEYQTTGEFPRVDATDAFNGLVDKRFRIWRYAIPRATIDVTRNPYGLDRIRNPWVNITFNKKTSNSDGRDLAQLHDVTMIYYE